MKEIELETEEKILNAYKRGELQKPVINEYYKTINFKNNPEKQIDVLKNIMNEGIKKFEEDAKRSISYSELREMFG
jgi:hypothetical protein